MRAAGLLIRVFGALLMLTALSLPLMRAPDRPVESLVQQYALPPSDFLPLPGGQLVHVRDEGPRADPVPIVLIHGTSASLHTWDGWTRALQGQRRVIRLDLPGFGLTGPYTGKNAGRAYHASEDARFTLQVLDAMGVQRFVAGGNSLGGEVAWRLAALAPQRVERLILVDAAGYRFEPASVPLGWRLAKVPVASRLFEMFLPRPMIVSGLVDVYGDPKRITDELVTRYYDLTLREGNRRALAERLRQTDRGRDEALIATLKLPTLILWGGRDRLIDPAFAQRFEKDIAGSQRVMFEALGHVPHEEDAAASVAPVRRFLGLSEQSLDAADGSRPHTPAARR